MVATRHQARGGYLLRLTAFVFACFAPLLPVAALASTSEALSWLGTQQNPNGSFGATPASLATPVQSTAEVIRAYQTLGLQAASPLGPAFGFLNGDTEPNTEFLARKIVVNGKASQPVASWASALIANQNADGGFGDHAGEPSTALDTAYALEALGTANDSTAQVVPLAVGYLLNAQSVSGAWPDNAGEDASIQATAQAMRTLWWYRSRYLGVEGALTNAQNYLLARRAADGLHGETHASGITLAALIMSVADVSVLSGSVAALSSRQQPDGSWDSDPYTTALALQVLALAANPPANPGLGAIQARIVDATTGQGLANATVTLTGASTQTRSTDANGVFRFNNLAPYSYSLSITLTDYAPVTGQTTVRAGETTDLGVIALVKNASATTGTVRGVITDATTGVPLSGVAVTATGSAPAITDATGAFQIAGVPAGAITVTAAKAGYASANGESTLSPGGILIFSPALAATGGEAEIHGRIVDLDTGAPLGGANVSLEGPAPASLTTAADGLIVFTALAPGNYTLRVSAAGYFGLSATIAANAGIVNIGDIAISRNTPATTGSVRGIVTDAQSSAPVAGATVRINGGAATATTDVNGAYAIPGIAPGSVVIEISAAGYVAAQAAGEVTAGGVLVFSTALTLQSAQATVLTGTASDGSTGARLAGVSISVSGASAANAMTDAQGNYRIGGLAPGTIFVAAAFPGYDTVMAAGTVVEGSTLGFSPVLYPANTTPANANATGIKGVVLDAGTSAPLVSATVTLDAGGTLTTASTDQSGAFTLTGFAGGAMELSVASVGYAGVSYTLMLEPLGVVDLGQIRLRKAAADVLQPDLVAVAVDGSAATNDPQSLALGGEVRATIANAGTANATGAITVTAFLDADLDGTWGAGETIVGTGTVNELAVGQSQAVSIPLTGTSRFRDEPVSVFADSGRVVVESNEANNVASTASACESQPLPAGTFNPVLKWESRKGSVNHTPLVGPLVDTNADGRIDQNDTPAIVAISGGRVTAFSGVDGRMLWQYGEIVANSGVTPALGDLDEDGKPEVVTYRNDKTVIAINQDGTLKWISAAAAGANADNTGLTIADLDRDGQAEVIAGNLVLNANGSLKWAGDPAGVLHSVPVVADLDLDGFPEVIMGPRVYRNDGQLYWTFPFPLSGSRIFTAVANLDGDPYPEIVAVKQHRGVAIVEHDGVLKWGLVPFSGGQNGGLPTVADFDGDGISDIGIADTKNYSVYNADGSLKWQVLSLDASGLTGSTVFDFEGDGRAEVVYAGETELRIFDGRNGAVLFSTPNQSATWIEYPTVADVDHDGHADIVAASSIGARMFGDQNNSWMATRGVWNEHAYHINNINDDGSIPRIEQNSWQTHNTYRTNIVPSAGGSSDLTVSLLRILDRGNGQGVELSVRVGNAGTAPVTSAAVTFHDGDPAAGGALLGTVTVADLAAGSFTTVTLSLPSLAATSDIYAVVDGDNRLTECREDNNLTHTPVRGNAQGTITVATDKTLYGPDSPVALQAMVGNSGSLAADYLVEFRIEDQAGDLVYGLSPQTIAALASGGTRTLTDGWNTGGILAGTYRLRALLLNAAGGFVAEVSSAFEIRHSDASAPSVTLRTNTDRPAYHTTDRVDIENLVTNTTINTLIDGALLRVTVRDPAGVVVFSQTSALGQLVPGGARGVAVPQTLTGAAVAVYTVRAEVLNAAQDVLAQAETRFEVIADLAKSLTGAVTIASASLDVGATQICTDTVTNNGTLAVSGLEIHRVLVNVDTQTLASEAVSAMSLAAQANSVTSRSHATGNLLPGNYACVLQARVNGNLATLGYAPFLLKAQPIRIEGELRSSARGRLLVLLDHPATDSNGNTNDADPLGPPGAPGLSAQRAYLEALLNEMQWSYTITETAEDFTRELRTAGYSAYALLSEQEKLPETVQKELREAVFRGEGLIEGGSHDQRQGRIDEALGVKFIGKHPDPVGIALNESPLGAAQQMTFAYAEPALHASLNGAQSAADYLLGSSPPPELTAVSYEQYGRGRSVYAGFDLLAQATHGGPQSPFRALIQGALDYLGGAEMAPLTGTIKPFDIALVNRGVEATVNVSLVVPPDSIVIEAAGATVSNGTLNWQFSLAANETRTLRFALRLPLLESSLDLRARVEAGTSTQSLALVSEPALALAVHEPKPLTDILADVDDLIAAAHPDSKALKAARLDLNRALGANTVAAMIGDLLKATDALLATDNLEVTEIRAAIGTWIRWASPYAY